MSRTTYVSIAVAIIATILSFITFLYSDEGILKSLGVSLLFSSPLLIFCGLFYHLSKRNKSFGNSLLYSSVFGAFILCSLLHLGFNGLMAIDVMAKGSWGPAQGYWLLVIIFGSIESVVFGAIIAVVLHLIYNQWHKLGSS